MKTSTFYLLYIQFCAQPRLRENTWLLSSRQTSWKEKKKANLRAVKPKWDKLAGKYSLWSHHWPYIKWSTKCEAKASAPTLVVGCNIVGIRSYQINQAGFWHLIWLDYLFDARTVGQNAMINNQTGENSILWPHRLVADMQALPDVLASFLYSLRKWRHVVHPHVIGFQPDLIRTLLFGLNLYGLIGLSSMSGPNLAQKSQF